MSAAGFFAAAVLNWVIVTCLLGAAVLTVVHAQSPEMVFVDGGSFLQGNERGDTDEKPVRQVSVSPFYIDKTEVTFDKYGECVTRGACTPAHYDDGQCLLWSAPTFRKVSIPQRYRAGNLPVVCVTWGQAREYCRFRGKRLPTEAQWEYAARNNATDLYSWGSAAPTSQRCTMSPSRFPTAVGTYPPSPRGLHDMTGNVWEWTGDLYQIDYYAQAPQHDPPGPEVGRYRVIRGGGWYSEAAALGATNRHWFSASHGEASIGFRCAK